jgi:hypothetical protein
VALKRVLPLSKHERAPQNRRVIPLLALVPIPKLTQMIQVKKAILFE